MIDFYCDQANTLTTILKKIFTTRVTMPLAPSVSVGLLIAVATSFAAVAKTPNPIVAPVLATMEGTPISFTEGAAATVVTLTTTISDIDNATMTGATIQLVTNYISTEDVLLFTNASGITGSFDVATGTMTLSGVASLANYTTAIRSVRYQNTNTNNPAGVSKSVSFTVFDGGVNSNAVFRSITITPTNDTPVLSAVEAATLGYTEDQAATIITSNLVVTDVDNATLASATVQITGGYSSTQDVLAFTPAFGITGSYNTSSGLLTLTGAANVSDYESALRSVTYQNTNIINPSSSMRTITFRVNDGTVNSNTQTRTITITLVNDAPVLAATEATALSYSEGQAATNITPLTTLTDLDGPSITGATVQITGNFVNTEDVLSFTNTAAITATFDAATGTLSLVGTTTVGNYQTALRVVRYQNTNLANPSSATRTVSFTATDAALGTSNTVTRNITVAPVNDVSVLSAIEAATLPYAEDQAPTAITAALTVADVDNTTLASATAQITSNYASNQDVLAFTDAMGITGSFNSVSGLLTLTGSATLGDYETALRSITYQNTNTISPSTAIRTVTFRVNDGVGNSNTQTRTITITTSNDAPVLSTVEPTDLIYNEGQSATYITATIRAADDNANLTGGVVQITGNYVSTEDVLSFANTAFITGSFDAATGTLTLTGTTSVSNYQNAFRLVRYRNTNNATPSPLTRTVSFTVQDASLSGNTVARLIAVNSVNDLPVAVNDVVAATEETPAVFSVHTNDTDVDNAIDATTVSIVTGPTNGSLAVNATTGEVTYTPTLNFSGAVTFTYNVKDVAGGTSNNATVTINVANINDVPVFTKGPDQLVNEDPGPQVIAGWATGVDDGDPYTNQNLTFVLTNTNNALFNTQPTVNAAGQLSYRTAKNISGTATVDVFLRDNGSNVAPNVNETAIQTFTITVLPLNDPPTVVDDFYSTSSNTPVSANLLTNDSDVEKNTMTFNTVPVVSPLSGSVVLSANGTFTYTPNGSYTGEDIFKYELCDDGSDGAVPAPRCSQGTVTITVNPPNDEYNIVGNNSIQIEKHCFILTKELENQQGAVWYRTPLDLRYSFELHFDAMFSDTSVVKDDGADGIMFALQRDYTPPPLFMPASPIEARGSVGEYLGIGRITPSIGIEVDTYQNTDEPAYDHIAISKNGSVYNIIAPPVPAKVDGTNAPMDIEDGAGHTVRLTWDKPTNTLTVYFDGVERTRYTGDIINDIFGGDPTDIYWGFSASTGGKTNYQAVCGLLMTPINLPPIAGDDTGTTDEDTTLEGTLLLANDSDPEGSALETTAQTKATLHGNVVIRRDGSYTYTPAANYNGSDSFTYQACDLFSATQCSQATVSLTVLPVNDAPVAVQDAAATPEEMPIMIDVVANDTDLENNIATTSVIVETSPAHGQVTVNPATGVITYTPDVNYTGTDSFHYTIKDSDGLMSNIATVTVTVSPVNDAPVATDDQITTRQIAIAIPVLNNDVDVDNLLSADAIIILQHPIHGTVVMNADGSITYTPDADYLGADSFTYQLTDPDGLISNVAAVAVMVTPANVAPIAVDDHATYSIPAPLTIDVLANDTDPDQVIGPVQIVSVTQPDRGSVVIDGDVIIFHPPLLYESTTITFTYTIQDAEGLTAEAMVVIDYIYKPLTVSEGFSPNGDGENEWWYIQSIENYPNNNLNVFNRWGMLVYSARHYNNNNVSWDGRANTGMKSGTYVDQGTYFYSLDLGNNSGVLSGYVVIIR